jgi:3-methylfumaryl-CoA hydratase
MTADISTPATPDWSPWIGRTETVHDGLAPAQAQSAAAMLDLDPVAYRDGVALPTLWHWFYFLPRAPQASLASDGHPERGGFLPPVALPRRMFAGARLTIHQPLTLGLPAEREGTIIDVKQKTGKSGTLAFVTVRYRFMQQGEVRIEEEQDIVYREPGAPVPPPVTIERPALPPETWVRRLVPDTRLLFRFSALTFNAHRIHYDRPYATLEEGYPGLVVHGPLIAVLLADLVHRHDPREITKFTFKGLAPLFDFGDVQLSGVAGATSIALAAHGTDGTQTMSAEAELATR